MCTAYYAIFSCAEKHRKENENENPEGFGLKCIDPCYFAELMSESFIIDTSVDVNAAGNTDVNNQQQQQQQQWRCPFEERENVFLAHDYNSLTVCLECKC